MIKPEKILLPNGMTVLLIESNQSPVVAFNACFRVGSVVENEAESGLCHYIEHMIFKGTPTLPAGQIASTIEASGGEINAYTSFDETVYYCTVSSRYFEEGLNVLSDAVMNPLFEEEEMAREKPVIIEEINRSHDTPSKVLSESLFKTAFRVHPYGKPIIGSKETVNSFTRQFVMDFYRRWYVPRNLVFVVAGDFDSKTAKEKITRIFEPFRDVQPPPLSPRVEPEQTEPRSILVRKPIESHYVQMAFPIPDLTHPDLPVLDILSHLMGEGLSSRLEQRIKEKRGLVDSVYSYAYTPRNPGLFVIGFTTREKKILTAATEILKEVFNLDHERISHEELSRARINIKSDAWYERETVEGLARKYGYFETIVGDYAFDRKYYQKIDEVDPDAVHEVAQKYFQKQKLNLALLAPEGSKISQEIFNPNRILAKSAPKAPKKKAPRKEVKVVQFKNGVRLVFKESPRLPLVAIRLVNFGGLRYESPKKNGVHHLLAQTLTKGTQTRSAEQLALETEQIAGSLDAFSGRNLDGMQGDFLSEKLETGLDLLFDVMLNPAFIPKEIEKERGNTLEAIRREQDHLASMAYKNFLKELYKNHPYALPVIGTAETVKGISRKDLLETHRELLNPKNMVVSMVGDFDSSHMEEILFEKLGKLKAIRPPTLKLPVPKPPAAPVRLAIQKKSKMQTHIVLGFLGTEISNRDRYALDVLNNILAGQGGRLFLELRDRLSLAYSVTSFSQEGVERGFFSVYIATEPQKTEKAVEGILKELKKIRSETVSESELDRAKKYIMGSYEIDLQRNSNVATHLAFNEIYGVGAQEYKQLPERIAKVSREEILKVAQKYLNLDAYILSIVGA